MELSVKLFIVTPEVASILYKTSLFVSLNNMSEEEEGTVPPQ